jgi:putative Mn2+ efflux pump MntP
MIIGTLILIAGFILILVGFYLIINTFTNQEPRCWSSTERELGCDINDNDKRY